LVHLPSLERFRTRRHRFGDIDNRDSGALGVSADRAFSAGFLFFVVTVAVALPGAAIVAWEGVRTRAVAGAAR